MEIRFCSRRDESQVRSLWEYCFEDSPEYVNFYFDKKFSPENTLVLDRDGRIISSIHLNQHNIHLRGRDFDLSYVVGVSTLPEVRGMGKMKDLMKYCLKSMYDRGQELAILMPIDFRLYTPFGFENCYDFKVEKLDIFQLKKFKLLGEFGEADSPKILKEIYDFANLRYNGYANRNERYFENFIKEMKSTGGHIYINYIEGIPSGYIAYKINEGVFLINEIYYRDINSYQSLLKFVFNHNTQAGKVKILTSVSSPLNKLLDNPKDATFEVRPFMMARVINFADLIDKLSIPYFEGVDNLKIKINDSYIEENNGCFVFGEKDGLLVTKKLVDEEFSDEIDISQLSALVFTYMDIEELEYLRGKRFKKSDILKKIFESDKISSVNYINEYV